MFPSASYIRYSVYYILFSVFLLIKILVTISEASRQRTGGQEWFPLAALAFSVGGFSFLFFTSAFLSAVFFTRRLCGGVAGGSPLTIFLFIITMAV